MDTDSLPGQTDIGDGNDVRSTSTLVDESSPLLPVEPGSDGQSSIPVDADGESSQAVTGGQVLAWRDFSDFSGKRVGLIASRASIVDGESIIDLLDRADDVDLVAIFAPEHGIRAEAGAGELIEDEIDPATGLPVRSLYGQTRQPTPDMLADIDILVFDLQDVGTRFYTYTATMGLAMQAAAEAGISFVVLDRPNPLGGHLVEGAIRAPDQESFVSQYPIPAVHGMTAGELALAIKGEGWLAGLEELDLAVAPLIGWDRSDRWQDTGLPWVPPSPGLATAESAGTYPAIVLFEATTLSYGTGTEYPFQQVGAPWLDGEALAVELNSRSLPGVQFRVVTFVPEAEPGGTEPRYTGTEVQGVRLEIIDGQRAEPFAAGIHLLDAVLRQAESLPSPPEEAAPVINRGEFLDLLTGGTDVRTGLEAGNPAADIVADWSAGVADFEAVRSQYLQYK